MEVFMGFVSPFGFNYAPQGWGLCNGAILPIQQYSALFSLLGTQYGGNGSTNFGLPDLRGRAIVGMGNGPGLTPRVIGEVFGVESATVALNATNLPAHNHTLAASNTASGSLTQAPAAGWTLGAPASVSTARPPVTTPVNMYNATALTPQNAVQSAPSSTVGGSVPVQVPTMPPVLCLNFCIAMNGLYPSRN